MYFYLVAWGLCGCMWISLTARSWAPFTVQCTAFCQRRLLMCSTGSGGQAQWLGNTGSGAPQHLESSQIRDQIQVPSLGRRILIHCTTKEVPLPFFLSFLT